MEDASSANNLTIRDYLRAIFRKKIIIMVIMISVMTTVYIGLKLQTPFYKARVKMFITAKKQVQSPHYRDLGNVRTTEVVMTQSALVMTKPVIDRVVRTLELDQRPIDYEKFYASRVRRWALRYKFSARKKQIAAMPEGKQRKILFNTAVNNLKSRITVEPVPGTNIFVITVRDYVAENASKIANVLSRSFIIYDLEQQLADVEEKYGFMHPIVMQTRDNIDKLKNNLTGEELKDIVEAIGPASVKIIEQARPPNYAIQKNVKMTLLFSLFTSLILGCMAAFILEYLDQTIRTPLEVESYLKFPFLGSIPKKKIWNSLMIKKGSGGGQYTRSYHNLADQIFLIIQEKEYRTLVVTSLLPSEGVSSVVANLGNYLANMADHRILIIDGNFRDSAQYKFFKISRKSTGLSDVLEGKVALQDAVKKHEKNLDILPSGATAQNPATLLDSTAMVSLLAEARQRYDAIFIDCANLKDYKDAAIAASKTDGVILVVSEGRIRGQAVKSLLAPLKLTKARIIGVILNNRVFNIPQILYERL